MNLFSLFIDHSKREVDTGLRLTQIKKSILELPSSIGDLSVLNNSKKIRKLLKDPRRFLLDSKFLPSNFKSIVNSLFEVKDSLDVIRFESFVSLEDLDNDKSLILIFNCNEWKREYISKYFTNNHLLFAPIKYNNKDMSLILERIRSYKQAKCVVVWGSESNESILNYCNNYNIPIQRVEDGFLRSAQLGVEYSRPLSLAFDKTGLYFDSNAVSDIENLLNFENLKKYDNYVEHSKALINLIKTLKISKYNKPCLDDIKEILGPKIRKRVLIVGQSRNDASLRLGGVEDYSIKNMIDIVDSEHDDVEIIYKPHPDEIYKNLIDLEEYRNVKVISEDVNIGDVFECVDQVYVYTSLVGMEALFYNLKVTVLGKPFYAGWGLTDDRKKIDRRYRDLSLFELFYISYVLYPTYEIKSGSKVYDCAATIFKLSYERFLQERKLLEKTKFDFSNFRKLSNSSLWERCFDKEFSALKSHPQYYKYLPIDKLLQHGESNYYQIVMGIFFVGNSGIINSKMISLLGSYLSKDVFESVLIFIWNQCPNSDIKSQIFNIMLDTGEVNEQDLLLLNQSSYPRFSFKIKDYQSDFYLATYYLNNRDFPKAENSLLRLLLSGYATVEVFNALATIASYKFLFEDAKKINGFAFNFLSDDSIRWRKGRLYSTNIINSVYGKDIKSALLELIVSYNININNVELCGNLSNLLKSEIGVLDIKKAALLSLTTSEASRANNKVSSFYKASILEYLEDYDGAIKIIEELLGEDNKNPKFILFLAKNYISNGDFEKAKIILKFLLEHKRKRHFYIEALKNSIVMNDYEWSVELLESAETQKISVPDIYYRKIYLGQGRIRDSYLSFRNMKINKTLKSIFKEKYIQTLNELCGGESLLVIACFGPGDEIRFASLYNKLVEVAPLSNIAITCDPRLHGLLQRSYNKIKFIPVARIRDYKLLDNFEKYDQLPSSDLNSMLDNVGWNASLNYQKVMLVTDFLGDVLLDRTSFNGERYLYADPVRKDHWQERVLKSNKGKKVVGISWRSSLVTKIRNEHYLSIEMLAPLLALDDYIFINLQYDDCVTELQWADKKFPNKIINFEDLDQFNDIENVAALMSCLDFIISPATTVAELAGALGVPTFLLSNSSELHWRKQSQDVDIWYTSLVHVEGDKVGDKNSLINNLLLKIERSV